MSKTNKNQKSITSFFKNPGQTSTNDSSASKPKSSPIVETKEIKKENEEEILKMPSSSPPPGPAPAPIPSAQLILSPKKPTVAVCPTIQRQPTSETEWINLSDRFLLTNRNFEVQYAHLYAERLGSLRKIVTKAAENRWDRKIPIKRMNDIIPDEECILVGILFKQMVLKPSIVKQIATENGFSLQPPRNRYVDPTDKLILEEETQRIELNGKIDVDQFVTGIVMAIRGYEDEKGVFIVKDYCFKDLSIPKQLSPIKDDRYILLASGFLLSETSIIFNQLEYLVNSLTQSSNIQSKQIQNILSNIIRFVVAGNLIESSNRLKETTNQAKYLTRKMTASSVEAMHSIDELFNKIAAITDIDIMPGVNDPSCHMLPQQPLHPCMFPSSSKQKSTHCLTNPYDFQIGDIRLLGTSGQNVDDIDLQSTIDNRVHILENCLNWGVIAPTCPDTLSCYPYVKNDPFIINDTPHVFFAGNQPKFETRLFKGPNNIEVRLICIPCFAQSNSCVALNLNTLECHEISFENQTPQIIQ
ncbi:unnamed protein product [Adineta steineri]|uniref:DNA polymerase delta small subunit n=1 Tax=Adineta steineri TaxID=433720 RepID=A0A818SWY3_9BILA|nr:unnamed protein product [Adineta steineri]